MKPAPVRQNPFVSMIAVLGMAVLAALPLGAVLVTIRFILNAFADGRPLDGVKLIGALVAAGVGLIYLTVIRPERQLRRQGK